MLAVTAALALLAGTAVAVLSARLDGAADAELSDRADAVIATLAPRDGTVSMLDTPSDDALDAGVWVADRGGGFIVQAPASAPVEAAVSALIADGVVATRDVPDATRLLARPFALDGGVSGVVVVAESLVPFRQTERDALGAMAVFGTVILLATIAGTQILLRLALRPVARMTAQARDWSEHDPERRFAMGPPRDELTALAATLDGLLTRSDAALHYEQRLTAEIAHELRTPLTRARVVTELALRRPRSEADLRAALSDVGADVAATADVLDALLAGAAAPGRPRGTGDPAEACAAACAEARRLPAADRLTIVSTVADEVPEVACDTRHVVRTLAPLLDNAVQAARSAVTVEVRLDRGADEVVLAVRDDGPGITAEEALVVLEPGVRGSAERLRSGSGLGLALATRLARTAGGRIAIVPGPGGAVELRLPPIGPRPPSMTPPVHERSMPNG